MLHKIGVLRISANSQKFTLNVTSLIFFSRRSKNICFRKLARQILKTIKINMAAMNLKSFCDFIVLCYGTNVIDDLEFILLCLITVNLRQITLTKSITNLTWKCLMTSSVLLNFVLQKVIFLGCLKHCNCLTKLFAAKKQLQITLKYCAYY